MRVCARSSEREERCYRNWINSSGVQRHVPFLYTGCRDGVVLLQLVDRLQPGLVQWER